jgi:hypothetical protein
MIKIFWDLYGQILKNIKKKCYFEYKRTYLPFFRGVSIIYFLYITTTHKQSNDFYIKRELGSIEHQNMEMQWVYISIATLLACYVFVNKFVRNFNGWYYHLKLRNKEYPLPPGDMGWPLIGNLLTFIKNFSSGQPDSFITNLILKYLSLSHFSFLFNFIPLYMCIIFFVLFPINSFHQR